MFLVSTTDTVKTHFRQSISQKAEKLLLLSDHSRLNHEDVSLWVIPQDRVMIPEEEDTGRYLSAEPQFDSITVARRVIAGVIV